MDQPYLRQKLIELLANMYSTSDLLNLARDLEPECANAMADHAGSLGAATKLVECMEMRWGVQVECWANLAWQMVTRAPKRRNEIIEVFKPPIRIWVFEATRSGHPDQTLWLQFIKRAVLDERQEQFIARPGGDREVFVRTIGSPLKFMPEERSWNHVNLRPDSCDGDAIVEISPADKAPGAFEMAIRQRLVEGDPWSNPGLLICYRYCTGSARR